MASVWQSELQMPKNKNLNPITADNGLTIQPRIFGSTSNLLTMLMYYTKISFTVKISFGDCKTLVGILVGISSVFSDL